MKQTPILFSTLMVQAILEGRKTQTRRVVKSQPIVGLEKVTEDVFFDQHTSGIKPKVFKCPYGQVGDVLWVRETWQTSFNENKGKWYPIYRADGGVWFDDDGPLKWKPSIHMQKKYARIWLRIKNVRVERLQDISEEDAIAEGVDNWTWKNMATPQNWMDYTDPTSPPLCSAYDSFCSLWDSINGEESWNSNPWVWVIEFERI